jgi:protein SCO1/2
VKPGGEFRLIDHHGAPVTDDTYRGKYVVIFFGFTHCKVVCPRALGKLTNVLAALGPLATEFTALYVTVDPERDSPDVMRVFLEQNYPRFTGLTGSPQQIEKAKKAFRVFARQAPDPDDPLDYSIPHTAITYVLDRQGQYATHFTDAIDEIEMTARLRLLIAS